MNALTRDAFHRWMEAYGRASKENDANASADLFTEDAAYYETPFDEPITGRDAIYAYWLKGAQTLTDKESSFEILAVKDDLGIARWQANFTNLNAGKRVALDCLFVVKFGEGGRCSQFREWWHTRVIDAISDNGASR